LIAWNDILLSAETNFLAKDTWYSDEQRSDEESGHDRESEDPLKGNDLEQELMNTEGSCDDG